MMLREVLHAHIPTLRPSSTYRDAVDKMDIYQFPALVITNEHMEVQAVVTEGDLARAAHQKDSVVRLSDELVMTFASRDPICAELDMEVSDAFHTMLTRGLTVLPVVDQGRLMGMVLRMDLMQSMLTDAAESLPPSAADRT